MLDAGDVSTVGTDDLHAADAAKGAPDFAVGAILDEVNAAVTEEHVDTARVIASTDHRGISRTAARLGDAHQVEVEI